MNIFKKKYKYNPETLQYEEVKFSFKKFVVRLIPYTISSFLFGILIMFLYIVVFESPEEKILRAENEYLEKNFEEMSIRLQRNDSLLAEIAKRDNYLYRTIFEQDSAPCVIKDAEKEKLEAYKKYEGYEMSELVKQIAKKLDQMESKMTVQMYSYNTLIKEAKNRQKAFSSLPVLQPIRPQDLTRIGSFFGYRLHPILNFVRMHTGIDMSGEKGTPIYAAGDGVVVKAESSSGYGNLVEIDHKTDGMSTRYGHLQKIMVKKGQQVKRGEQIGTLGNTGLSTSPHLHYEILINGKQVNPLRYMITPTAEEYQKIIESAKYKGVSFD